MTAGEIARQDGLLRCVGCYPLEPVLTGDF